MGGDRPEDDFAHHVVLPAPFPRVAFGKGGREVLRGGG